VDRDLTIDQLAQRAGTTGRQVRALQTQGLLPHPRLVGRTGYYSPQQLARLQAVLRLQREGFSLAGIAVLFRALDVGMSLEQVVGLGGDPAGSADGAFGREDAGFGREMDGDDEYGGWPETRQGQLLSVVPPTVLDLSLAS
jgi:hypothetical protein